MRLAGDGRLDGVLGGQQAELDQLAVADLQPNQAQIFISDFSTKILLLKRKKIEAEARYNPQTTASNTDLKI